VKAESRFLHRFKQLLTKGLELLVQLLTWMQISDESDTLLPDNEKQQRMIQPEEMKIVLAGQSFGGLSLAATVPLIKGNEGLGNEIVFLVVQ